jgi:outer membrane biosynthesis protein TonB
MGLDQRAVEAVSAWQFRPATKDDEPVDVLINVEVNFHLY